MGRKAFVGLLALSLTAVGVGCDDDDPTGPTPEVFRATMNGANEEPDPRTTPATGTAELTLVDDELSWVITMSNITNVNAAHIHIGAADVAGGVLLGLTPPISNTRIEGSITRAQFQAPAAPNQAVTWDDMLDLMRTGGAYVNVHTNNTANDPTNNTGPGDFPGGEIRGQIVRISGP
jgi:hypothetical protein